MNASLIHTDGRVLAALDLSTYAPSVAAHATWAASRLGAELEFLHAIDRAEDPAYADLTGRSAHADLSGNLALGAQESLLAELVALDEKRGKLAQAHGRALLERLRDEAGAAHGVRAQVRQRHGALLETLLGLESETRLLVIGKRGEHADLAKGHLGGHLERVLRAVHRPVLVASRAFAAPKRFLIAFDGSATTRRCVEMVAVSPLLRGLECDLLMAAGAADNVRRETMAWATTVLTSAGFAPRTRIVEGAAEAAIAGHVERERIDLLVMGAYGHSRIRSMILGSTTTQLLRTCRIPVLLLR